MAPLKASAQSTSTLASTEANAAGSFGWFPPGNANGRDATSTFTTRQPSELVLRRIDEHQRITSAVQMLPWCTAIIFRHRFFNRYCVVFTNALHPKVQDVETF
jgi:hypothetical protein